MRTLSEEIELQRRLVEEKKLRYGLEFSRYYHDWYSNTLLARLPPDPASRILDCGCGTGILLPLLDGRYRSVVGLDLSVDNLTEAQRVRGRAHLVLADIGRLPLAPASFDAVVCRGVLYRVPDVARAFGQLFHVLKDGGRLVIAEPIDDSPMLRLLRSGGWGNVAHTYASRTWVETAQVAGFRVSSSFNLGYVAWALVGFPELTHVMRFVPMRMTISRVLMRLDRLLARTPVVKAHSWHRVFHFQKVSSPSDAEYPATLNH
jgi:SAM-dependent methyltransferase